MVGALNGIDGVFVVSVFEVFLMVFCLVVGIDSPYTLPPAGCSLQTLFNLNT